MTAYEMRMSDWGSDVCSSDRSLVRKARLELARLTAREPKSRASTNSATLAKVAKYISRLSDSTAVCGLDSPRSNCSLDTLMRINLIIVSRLDERRVGNE